MRNNEYDIVALGELLIDFTPYGKSNQNNDILEVNPGGAPCNLLAMANKLGSKTAFIGKVGDDKFGKLLNDCVENQGIDVSGLIIDKLYKTTLAFVHLSEGGDRSFSFYRNPSADMMLKWDEVNTELIEKTKIFHFGTLSLTNEPVKDATTKAIDYAKAKNKIISFDPNIRPLLWNDIQDAKEAMLFGLSVCDILKISEEELFLAMDINEVERATEILCMKNPSIKLVFVTLGKEGCYYKWNGKSGYTSTLNNIKVIDTTGAGDAFFGCALHYISRVGLDNLDEDKLKGIVHYANVAASIVTTKKGALMIMPSIEEIENCL